jgi:hypothetical protein
MILLDPNFGGVLPSQRESRPEDQRISQRAERNTQLAEGGPFGDHRDPPPVGEGDEGDGQV